MQIYHYWCLNHREVMTAKESLGSFLEKNPNCMVIGPFLTDDDAYEEGIKQEAIKELDTTDVV